MGPVVAAGLKYGIPIASGLLGGKGAKKQAQAASQPTKITFDNYSSLSPAFGEAGNAMLQDILGRGYANLTRDLDIGPSSTTQGLFNEFTMRALNGPGIGMGLRLPEINIQGTGLHIPEYTPIDLLAKYGGVGGGAKKLAPIIRDFHVDPNDYQESVMAGNYLNAGNPYLQEVLENFQREAAESYRLGTVPQIDATAIRAGRYGSGAYSEAQARGMEEYSESVQSEIARMLAQQYQFERGMQDSVSQQLTQADIAGRSNLTQAEVARTQASASLKAALASADVHQATAAYQTLVQANIAKYNGSIQKAIAEANLELQRAQAALGARQWEQAFSQQQLGDAFNASQYIDQRDVANKLLPDQMLAQYAGLVLPLLQAFGQQHNWGSQIQQGPKYSSGTAGLMGGLGGVFSGLGLAGQLGLYGDWFNNIAGGAGTAGGTK